MPRINRVRIVNFSYNNNNRHIIDECFDFYGGENALLSLANGGGKSVLVQAMLQPILPKVALLGRKFADFFIAKRTPSYIMVEWKLDDDAGYLLSGISIASKLSHSTNEEEENVDIRYFTFLSEYEEANDFDIKHIPVTEQVGSSVKIASYNEFKKFLQKEAGKNNTSLFVYDSTRDEQSLYEKKLNNYSISREEWKELIVNINQAEHGVSEVFSECKTSRRVMEQWVIKYIEKVLNKSSNADETDHKKLETMMAQVAQALVDNEKHIREFKAIEGFITELESLYGDAKEVLSRLDDEDRLKKDVSSGYIVVKNEEERLGQELVNLENRLRELDEELELIELEEKSQEIYKYADEIKAIDEQLLGIGEKLEEQKSYLDEKKHHLTLQKAAERHGRIVGKRKSIAELQQRLENVSKDQEKLLKEMNRVKYSLKTAYNQQILNIKKDMEIQNEELKGLKDEVQSNERKSQECQKQLEKLNEEKGRISEKIEIFESEEPEILKKLNVDIFRNPFLKELDQNDIEKVKNRFSKDCQTAEKLLEDERNEAEKLKDTLGKLQMNREAAFKNDTTLKVEQERIAARTREYEDDRQKLLGVLRKFNIGPEYIYDQMYLAKAAKEHLNEWENKVYNLKMEISELEKQIHSIEKGVSYLPVSLISRMEEQNLPCYTGEKYLREIDEEDKKKLLIENPLLPYALIATEKEISLIEHLVADMELSQIIPVIRHNQREHKFKPAHESIQFITSAGNMSLNSEDIGIFTNDLLSKKDEKIREMNMATEIIDRVSQDYRTIINFKWTKEQAEELEQERLNNEEEIRKNNEVLNTLSQQIEDANKQQETLVNRIEDLKQELLAKQVRIQDFESYLTRNSVYMKNVHLKNEIQGKINNLSEIKKRYDEDKIKLQSEAEKLQMKLVDRKNNLKAFEDKLAEVTVCDKDELVEGSISELEGRLEACKSQQNNEVSDLNDRINGFMRDIEGYEKEIRKFRLDSEEYKSIEYSESVEAELEALCERLRKEIEALTENQNEQGRKKERLRGRMDAVRKTLGSKSIVPIEKIRGNFSERREAIDIERYANREKDKNVNKERRELAGLIARIETEIKDVRSAAVIAHKNSYEEVKASIDSMLQEYSEFRRKSNEAISLFCKKSDQFVINYSKSEESTVKEAIKGLQYQIDALDRSYDKYYYLIERIEYYFKQLGDILKIMENKMLQLEHSQKDLTEHAFMEARRIYYEIPKISENSAVEIDGVRKKVLEIVYDEMEDELQAKEKMSGYIQDCLQSLTKLIKESEDENKLRRDIEKFMSTKELLNIISSLEKCKIRAYKVDLNEKNRGMMLWEDIIVKNSGGEKFVAYFSLLVALISYSRKQTKGYEAFNRSQESKVLIMDNPFGPITSGHLLKPMFDIAKKYNTQLICLSDIKQGSVVNSFDLIYMIKIRQNMMQEDYLELEPVMLKDLKQDEKLENAHFYGKVEQMSLFD